MNIRRLMLYSLLCLGLNAALGNKLSAQEISVEQNSSYSIDKFCQLQQKVQNYIEDRSQNDVGADLNTTIKCEEQS